MLFRSTLSLALITALLAVTAQEVCAQINQFIPEAMSEAGVDEHLDEQLPLGLTFTNDENQTIALGDLFQDGKPAVLSLNYSNCPMLCVLQLNGLVEAMKQIDLVAGRDFRVISVSLDPEETTAQASLTKQKYLESYGGRAEAAGWNFLTGSAENITALAKTVGIRYVYLPKKKEYSHPAVFCICMPNGRISRYHYGIEFPPQTIRLSLVEASEGKIGTAFDQFLLLCFHYDADEGRYAPAARNLMKLGGLLAIFAIGLLIWTCHRIGKKRGSGEGEISADRTVPSLPLP